MPALHHDDGSVSLVLNEYGAGSPTRLLERTYTKDEWDALKGEAAEAGTTVFELLRARVHSARER